MTVVIRVCFEFVFEGIFMQRINARLDDDRLNKLQHLKSLLHVSTTEIVLRAIDELYEQQTSSNKAKLTALLNSDFVACGEADYDLSRNHKAYLGQSLTKKYDNS